MKMKHDTGIIEKQDVQNLSHGDDQDPLFLFLHMPKNAGTTFRVHIENNLEQDEVLPLYVDIDKRYRDRNFLREYVTSLPEGRKRKLKLVYGHEVHYGIHEWRQGMRTPRTERETEIFLEMKKLNKITTKKSLLLRLTDK